MKTAYQYTQPIEKVQETSSSKQRGMEKKRNWIQRENNQSVQALVFL